MWMNVCQVMCKWLLWDCNLQWHVGVVASVGLNIMNRHRCILCMWLWGMKGLSLLLQWACWCMLRLAWWVVWILRWSKTLMLPNRPCMMWAVPMWMLWMEAAAQHWWWLAAGARLIALDICLKSSQMWTIARASLARPCIVRRGMVTRKFSR